MTAVVEEGTGVAAATEVADRAPGSGPVPGPGPGRSARAATLVLALPVLLLAVGALSRVWIADDGLINVRLVDEVLAGHGPSFNGGIRAETGTSTLWLALVSLVAALPGLDADLVAVAGGVLLTVAGLALGAGALRRASGAALVLPLGLLAYAAYPIAWDFATGGLENGLVTLWLGAVARYGLDRPVGDGRRRVAVGVLLGLGPLLRPDLALMSAVLLVAASGIRRPRPWIDVRLVVAALALPVVTTVARAAYYASLVPAAGVAKEGTSARIGQGVTYVVSSLAPGGLVAIAVVAGAVVLGRRSSPSPSSSLSPSLSLSPSRVVPARSGALALAGALHLAYVVVVGGDFMLGRMLLPGLFALALAAGGLVVPRVTIGRSILVAAGLAVVVLAALPPTMRTAGVVDEREFYADLTHDTHPTSVDDYRASSWAQAIRAEVAAHPGSLILMPHMDAEPAVVLPLSDEVASRYGAVVVAGNLGAAGTAVADDVAVLDPIGLADPVAAHLRLLERGRPGHEKALAMEWYVARFAAPDAPLDPSLDPDDVAAARRALGCGDLATLVEATTADLTLDRLVDNALAAPRLTRFRFHPDPQVAADELCG